MSDQSQGRKTAHERWELADFSDRKPTPVAEQAAQHTAAAMQELMEVARLREEAKITGHEAGYAEGYAAGLQESRAATSAALAQISNIGDQLTQEIDRVIESCAVDIYSLALDIAKAVIAASITANKDAILNIIKKSIRDLPFNNGLVITVNPTDYDTVSKAFGEQIAAKNWHIADDETISPGGCLLDTAKNHIDATIETRWRSIARQIGNDNEWVDNAA